MMWFILIINLSFFWIACIAWEQVGQKLAETLIERKMMGNRPVTLIGFR